MTIYNLGPLEQKVIRCVWRYNRVSVKDVYTCLRKERKIAYTTVMTVMTRLTRKGLLKRKLEGRVYFYFPRKSKEKIAKNTIKEFLRLLVDQYGKEAITAFTDELKKYK